MGFYKQLNLSCYYFKIDFYNFKTLYVIYTTHRIYTEGNEKHITTKIINQTQKKAVNFPKKKVGRILLYAAYKIIELIKPFLQ